MTPVQIAKNVLNMFRSADTWRPSEELKHFVSIEIAANALAQEQDNTTLNEGKQNGEGPFSIDE
jgi:hypothetical protein